MKRRHHRRGVEFYRQFLGPGDLCFDVGANVGDRTRLFRDIGATVVAIEPQNGCVDALRERFGADEGVSIAPQAIGASIGEAEISISVDDPTISTMSTRWRTEGRFAESASWRATQTVEVTTLDALIERFGRPAFCKVDVEGFEKQVFEGLSTPLPCVSFEFTREFFDDAIECVSLLCEIGPTQVSYSLGESMALATGWMEPEELAKELRHHEDPRLWGDIYVRSRN